MTLNAYRIEIDAKDRGNGVRIRHLLAASPEEAYDRMRADGENVGEGLAERVPMRSVPINERIREICLLALAAGLDPERIGRAVGGGVPGDFARVCSLERMTKAAGTTGIGLTACTEAADGFQLRHVRTETKGATLRRIIDAADGSRRQADGNHDDADGERLDWIEAEVVRSKTGVSFDWMPTCEGEPSGYRFMRHHWIGEQRRTLRAAIDEAMAARSPQPAF